MGYLTTEEVAERFRTTPETVRYWKHVGKGPTATKVGRRVLYEDDEVERWAAEHRQVGTAPTGRPEAG
jgi:excisionase family DNA binding protein